MNSYGERIRLTIFGESHGPAIGCVLEGLPPGTRLDQEKLRRFLARRAPGQGTLTTLRKEDDIPEFLSGIQDGVLTGAALCAIIRNTDQHSNYYANLKDVPRPGHADYPASVKFHGYNDIRGGGIFSGRLTAPLCIAGGIVLQLLEAKGIRVGAHVAQIGDALDTPFNPINVTAEQFDELDEKGFPAIDDNAAGAMMDCIENARMAGDSIGGAVECAAIGVPAGIGDPMFGGLENRIAQAVFGIPAVKAVSFGIGTEVARLHGSENNDEYYFDKTGQIRTKTNNCGGILGGISTGMPILFKAFFKPTPSISREQSSVSLSKGQDVPLTVTGRHDPCIAVRALPVVIAATALAIYESRG